MLPAWRGQGGGWLLRAGAAAPSSGPGMGKGMPWCTLTCWETPAPEPASALCFWGGGSHQERGRSSSIPLPQLPSPISAKL